MARPNLLELVHDRVVFADGAMGTMLFQHGVFLNTCFDELNLSQPHLVREVHRDFLSAGADVLETNTFMCNRMKLQPHGLDTRVCEIAAAGVSLAREEARGGAGVAVDGV